MFYKEKNIREHCLDKSNTYNMLLQFSDYFTNITFAFRVFKNSLAT